MFEFDWTGLNKLMQQVNISPIAQNKVLFIHLLLHPTIVDDLSVHLQCSTTTEQRKLQSISLHIQSVLRACGWKGDES